MGRPPTECHPCKVITSIGINLSKQGSATAGNVILIEEKKHEITYVLSTT